MVGLDYYEESMQSIENKMGYYTSIVDGGYRVSFQFNKLLFIATTSLKWGVSIIMLGWFTVGGCLTR